MSEMICGKLTLKGGAKPLLGARSWKYRDEAGRVFRYGDEPWPWVEVKGPAGRSMMPQRVSGPEQAGQAFARFMDGL